ncbi:hypothetical protein [Streptomyces sp. AJS327]|uniref:hypothetical protein n=1 Tax=Streptomyces sp. AJS327 TaxID=2545265 RepID=UPI0027E541E7|nr:hypothetical protein [Streptomyces sp. AJS327]
MAAEDARDAERGPRKRAASLRRFAREPRVPHEAPERRRAVRDFLGVVAERVIDVGPRIPVRDAETLRRQFPGLGTEQIADRLTAGAMRGSAVVGAGVGAAAMLPVPPAMPAELATEIVGVASVELKLIAELHEIYGCPAPGDARQRAMAYLGAWSSERGIDVVRPSTLSSALGGPAKRELRQQIMKRTVRNLPNLTPFLVGAAVGATMNRRDTRKVAHRVRSDLRTRRLDSPGPLDLDEPRVPRQSPRAARSLRHPFRG